LDTDVHVLSGLHGFLCGHWQGMPLATECPKPASSVCFFPCQNIEYQRRAFPSQGGQCSKWGDLARHATPWRPGLSCCTALHWPRQPFAGLPNSERTPCGFRRAATIRAAYGERMTNMEEQKIDAENHDEAAQSKGNG
jgi:hypothetical protein